MRFSAATYGVLAAVLDYKWDMDTVNNLDSGTLGSQTKTGSHTMSLTNSAANRYGTARNKVIDWIVKTPATAEKGVYARLSGNTSSLPTTDFTVLDMTKLKNTTLKENTEYHISLWGAAEVGETVDIDVVVVEWDGVTEHVIPMTLGGYGKYTDTFTTSVTLNEPRVSVFFRLKNAEVPFYVTGFAITEQAVNSIEEANERQALAAYSFI
jgi:hypothetical protein